MYTWSMENFGKNTADLSIFLFHMNHGRNQNETFLRIIFLMMEILSHSVFITFSLTNLKRFCKYETTL